MTALIPAPYRWMILALLLAAGVAFGWVKGSEHTQVKYEGILKQGEIDFQKGVTDLLQRRITSEQKMAANAAKEREDHAKDLADADARAIALSRRLRDRAARPTQSAASANMPDPGSSGARVGGGTGAGLFRDDGEFLVRLAHAAKVAQSERDLCRREYEQARQELLNFVAGKTVKP